MSSKLTCPEHNTELEPLEGFLHVCPEEDCNINTITLLSQALAGVLK